MNDMYNDDTPQDLDLMDAMRDAMGETPPEDFMDDAFHDEEDEITISKTKHDAILHLLEVLVRSHETLAKKVSEQDKEIAKLKDK